MPRTAKGRISISTSAQELLWHLELTPCPRDGEEVRIGYFIVSLVNMLWDHILSPSFPSLFSHRLGSTGPLLNPAPLAWPILQANSQ